MKIHFQNLILTCRKSKEIIDLSHQISIFHGKISAGKSSIARLIDYCLGGELEKTPAISKEFISAELFTFIGNQDVVFERGIDDASRVQVTWKNEEKEISTVSAPINAEKKPIWREGNEDVYCLSDLIFYLSGQKPIKVRKSKLDDDSPLVRLSFRDLMWYCYLKQDDLDSSFYNLRDPYKQLKSRDVMRFVTGLYTERENELAILLDDYRKERLVKLDSIKQIRIFLQDFGFGSEAEVADEMYKVKVNLKDASTKLAALEHQYVTQTHFVDQLREKLRNLSDKLANEEEILGDLQIRIQEQEALRAELLSAKFKSMRVESATTLLSGVEFEICPACGIHLGKQTKNNNGICYLCKSPSKENDNVISQAEIFRKDMLKRVEDLSESVARHKKALKKQQVRVDRVRHQKEELDNQLNEQLVHS